MSHYDIRRKAISLRTQGYTYSQIKQKLLIPKSTLSNWLTDYPLDQQQMDLLRISKEKGRELAVEKIRITKQKKREKRLKEIYNKNRKKFLSLTKRELIIAGLFLYWGEGNKSSRSSIALNNTDPQIVLFMLFWLIKIFKVPKEKIKVQLHLYNDMDPDSEQKYWQDLLHLPISQFNKPYIKISNKEVIDHKGFGHGTCGLVVNNTRLKEDIIMSIKGIADFYEKEITMV